VALQSTWKGRRRRNNVLGARSGFHLRPPMLVLWRHANLQHRRASRVLLYPTRYCRSPRLRRGCHDRLQWNNRVAGAWGAQPECRGVRWGKGLADGLPRTVYTSHLPPFAPSLLCPTTPTQHSSHNTTILSPVHIPLHCQG
jgi:hypothetical protein